MRVDKSSKAPKEVHSSHWYRSGTEIPEIKGVQRGMSDTHRYLYRYLYIYPKGKNFWLEK